MTEYEDYEDDDTIELDPDTFELVRNVQQAHAEAQAEAQIEDVLLDRFVALEHKLGRELTTAEMQKTLQAAYHENNLDAVEVYEAHIGAPDLSDDDQRNQFMADVIEDHRHDNPDPDE